jgi:predicted dehydrogenase
VSDLPSPIPRASRPLGVQAAAKKARIGIIGAGFWAALFYLPFLRDHPQAECVGVVRRNADALAALQRGFDLEVATPDVGELLAAGCDGVIVASANPHHREHAEAALRAGAHVLMEKPMTVTFEDAVAVVATARECERILSIAHGWNYSRMASWAMDVIATGRLGRLTWISGHQASSLTKLFEGQEGYGIVTIAGYRFEASTETWARREAGGGYLYGQLAHQLGLALALCDSPPRDVFARLNTVGTGVDIDAAVSVAFENGVVGSFSGHGRLPWNTRYPLELRLAGEHGVMTLDFERERADVHLQEGSSARNFVMSSENYAFGGARPELDLEPAPGEGVYDNEGPTQFLIDLCLGRDPQNRAPDTIGVRSVAIIEAAWRSAGEGGAIRVDCP